MLPSKRTQQSQSYSIHAIDPNDKSGPRGYGSAEFVPASDSLGYQVRFENKSDATAPARLITLTDVLDPNLDLSTLLLTEITFADQVVAIPDGLNRYATTAPFTAGTKQIVAEVEAALDVATRTLALTIRAIDPETGWYPEDARVGILYPEDGTGIGQGSISYLVSPRQGLPSGTTTINRARIIFDFNDPIDTPQVLNTLDAGAPSSDVLPIATPDLGANTFPVAWTGDDDPGGSGIESFDIYVSADGVHYNRWLQGVADNVATFSGAPGTTYHFFSIARDHVGNVEAWPETADASVTLPVPPAMLKTVELDPDGRFKLTAFGAVGIAFNVEASTDLVEWTEIGVVTANQAGQLEFLDPDATHLDHRFYRLRGP